MKGFQISAVNINGLRDRTSQTKADTACHLFHSSHSPITFLLDTRLNRDLEHRLTRPWPGTVLFAHNELDSSAGIAALLLDDIPLNRVIRDPCGRYLMLDFALPTMHLLLVAVYAPASDPPSRKRFFNDLKTKIASLLEEDQSLVLLGDFNMVETLKCDRDTCRPRHDPSLPQFHSLKHTLDLEDIWRKQHPHATQYTFTSPTGHRSRIDRAYTSRDIRALVSHTSIVPFVHSDHDVLCLRLTSTSIRLGKGRWRLDKTILPSPAYHTLISDFWTEWRARRASYDSVLDWWDAGKLRIQRLSSDFARQARLAPLIRIDSLRKRLRNASHKPTSPSFTLLTAKLSTELASLERRQAQRSLLAAKTQWVEQGEKCTKFFLNLQKKQRQATTIPSLLSPDGTLLDTTPQIVSSTHDFYSHLYSTKPTSNNLQNIFLSYLDRSLSPAESSSCEGPITLPELDSALRQLNLNKSPGLDGLPVEFYTTFWPLLKSDLHAVSTYAFTHTSLSSSQQHAVLTLLPKTGDLRLLRNWRPLSLLNVDYKLFAKVISNRLFRVLPSLVHEDQTCSISNRQIAHNLSLIRDFIAYSKIENIPASLLTLDQKKAFDQVDHAFLRKILNRFNLGPDFLRWFDVLYANAFSCAYVNNTLSSPFPICRGVRQGCPLAPLLYVLYVEVLAAAIRKNSRISGLTLNSTTFKVSLYADDITLFLTSDASFAALHDTLTQYELASGAQVNPDKCQGLWLGSNRFRTDSPLSYHWSSHSVKILGIHFTPANDFLSDWHAKTVAFKKTLALWKQRSLSLKGRIVVVTQLAMSKFPYLARIAPCPGTLVLPHHDRPPQSTNYLRHIHDAVCDFLWNGKQARIDFNVLCLPVALGGLNAPHIERKLRSLRLTWLQQLFSPSVSGKWRVFMTHFLDRFNNLLLAENVFKTYLNPNATSTAHVPPFYAQLLRDWVALTANRRPLPTHIDHILNEPLFFNPHIVDTSPLRPTTYLTRPTWFSQVTPKSLTLVKDICYGVVPGFHSDPQLLELTGSSLVPPLVHHIRSCLPVVWSAAIVSQAGHPARNDIAFIATDESGLTRLPTLVSTTTSKHFYHSLNPHPLSSLIEDSALTGTFFYRDWDAYFPLLRWPQIFRRMYADHSDRPITDLQYKLIHNGGIATRLYMFTKRILRFTSPNCLRCNQLPETIKHLFLDCADLDPLKALLPFYFSQLFPTVSPSWDGDQYILAGYYHSPLPPHLHSLAEFIRKAYFHAVWFQRNQQLWSSLTLPLIPLFTSKLQSYLTSQLHLTSNTHLPQFYLNYGRNIVFTLRQDLITVLLLQHFT